MRDRDWQLGDIPGLYPVSCRDLPANQQLVSHLPCVYLHTIKIQSSQRSRLQSYTQDWPIHQIRKWEINEFVISHPVWIVVTWVSCYSVNCFNYFLSYWNTCCFNFSLEWKTYTKSCQCICQRLAQMGNWGPP